MYTFKSLNEFKTKLKKIVVYFGLISKRLLKHDEEILTFLEVPGLPQDNHAISFLKTAYLRHRQNNPSPLL